MALPSGDITHWTVDENKREMQISDDAFIARDLARFNHAPDVVVYYTGGVVMNLTAHLTDMRLTYSMFSDVKPHNHDYKVLFGEGDWTVAVSQVTGVNDGPLPGPNGLLAPTRREIKYDLMTICQWNGGLMSQEFLWSDEPRMYRQLGLLPSIPPDVIPDIETNPFTTPISTNPAVNSSARNAADMLESDTAFNNAKFDAESMYLSPNISVYGLSDYPLDLRGYLHVLKQMRTAFSDLHLQVPYIKVIADGDWTATISMLSGTHTGELVLPPYLAEAPIPPTNKKFKLLHYVISRWQDGEIVEMRVNADIIGILESLGISPFA